MASRGNNDNTPIVGQRGKVLNDATGRKLRTGQTVHLALNGMFAGVVAEVHEGGIDIPGRGKSPSGVLVSVPLSLLANPDGSVNNLYIVGEPATPGGDGNPAFTLKDGGKPS